jgi:hypothetical protein
MSSPARYVGEIREAGSEAARREAGDRKAVADISRKIAAD